MIHIDKYKLLSVPYQVRTRRKFTAMSGYTDGCMTGDITLFDDTPYNASKCRNGILIFNAHKLVFFGGTYMLDKWFRITHKSNAWRPTIDTFNKVHADVAKIEY